MGKFYWLKLQKDFFKKHKMVILRSMENGLLYESIFIHLMAESIDHDACLRFSDSKPYTPKTLSPLVGTDSKTMADALEVFQDLELIEILEDGTIFVPLAAENIGFESTWAEKKRQYRDKQRTDGGQSEDNERTNQGQKEDMSDKSIEIRDKRLEIRYKKESKEKKADDESSATPSDSKKRFVPPTVEEVAAYCKERNNGISAEYFVDSYSAKGWMIGKTKMKDWRAAVRKWESMQKEDPKPKKRAEEIPIMEKEFLQDEQEKKEMADLDWFLRGE